ncbi:protein mono-ADP-ribosyltransferase PARP10 isoform X2 [Oryzias melastigma]|nr:protein mono-ADP-ribosyltransferase PARP10 isoform X2 [Oryzias melastigma]XP_024113661.1 protein mono-ADP-ribosyltransferase PARP10 isoform X2 [Oryzias melastigma]
MSTESEEERSVEVLALSEEVDEELLCLYFENKRRSGGGPLELQRKDGRTVLVFEEAQAADRVLSKGPHVVHNVKLQVRRPPAKDPCRLLLRGLNPNTSIEMVELYVENMIDLNVGEYTLFPSPGRDVLLIHLSQPISKEFQALSSQISKRKLDGAVVCIEQLSRTDSVLVENLQPGTNQDLLTLYFESERGGGQRVKDVRMLSAATAKVSFVNFESVDLVLDRQHKLENTELALRAYFDFLQPPESLTPRDSETEQQDDTTRRSQNHIQMQASSPLANGDGSSRAKPSAAGARHTSKAGASEESMDVQSEEAETLQFHVAIPDPAKQAVFVCSTFQKDLQKANPGVDVQVKDDGVLIAGADRLQLEQLRQTLLDFLNAMQETRFSVAPEEAEFFSRKDVEEYLLTALRGSGTPAVYTVLGPALIVTALSADAAATVCSFLKSQVKCVSIPVNAEQECMLHLREWLELLQTLSFTSAKMSDRGGQLDVLTLKGKEKQTERAIRQFLTSSIERETVMAMKPGMLKYLQTHCHQLLADMNQVSIIPSEAEDVCGLKIHGPAVACQMAEEVLQGVVSSICTRSITVNAPGVTRFLEEKECRSILNEMESKFVVYICPKYVPWSHLPHQDIFETAWTMMSQKSLPKMSVDAKQTGLRDEVKERVSSMGTKRRKPVEHADQLYDLENVDLYSDPTSLSDQNSASLLGAPKPFADLNGAGGVLGLSKNLGEEAQLSLAIQYSMEAEQRSTKDDEAQLQKALELSKTMTERGDSSGSNKQTKANTPIQEAIQAANSVQLDVFAGYNCDLIRVDIAFKKKVSQRQVEEKVEHRAVANMSDYHKTCLEMIKRKHGVAIDVQGTSIVVSGFKDYVVGAVWDTKLLLEKLSNSVSDREILKAVQWVQHHPASPDPIPYSDEATVFLEKAWRMKLKTVDVLFDHQPHSVNFDKMQEYSRASGESVKISRKLLELGDLTQDVPEEELSLLSNLPDATKITEDSEEFQNVVKNFYATIYEHHSKIRIIQVERLMNRLLYNQYKLKKASVLQLSTHPVVERTLYHGTSETSVKEICVHGFNRSFCGKNATVYGQGVYFAVNSSLSVQDQYSPPNADQYKFIFVSKVLTGDFTKGCHSMKTAPLKETGDIPLRYDSVTDDINKPTMFVIFNDTQAFPEYLITCQRIQR